MLTDEQRAKKNAKDRERRAANKLGAPKPRAPAAAKKTGKTERGVPSKNAKVTFGLRVPRDLHKRLLKRGTEAVIKRLESWA